MWMCRDSMTFMNKTHKHTTDLDGNSVVTVFCAPSCRQPNQTEPNQTSRCSKRCIGRCKRGSNAKGIHVIFTHTHTLHGINEKLDIVFDLTFFRSAKTKIKNILNEWTVAAVGRKGPPNWNSKILVKRSKTFNRLEWTANNICNNMKTKSKDY